MLKKLFLTFSILLISMTAMTAIAAVNTEKQIAKMINIAFDVVSRKHTDDQLKILNAQFAAQKTQLTKNSIYQNIKDLHVTSIADAQIALDKLSDIEMALR